METSKLKTFIGVTGLICLISILSIHYVVQAGTRNLAADLKANQVEHFDTIKEARKLEHEMKMLRIKNDLKPVVNEHSDQIKAAKAWAPIYAEQVRKDTMDRNAEKAVDRVSGAGGEKRGYQKYAYLECLNSYGWTEYDFECLVYLWNRESGWSASSHNGGTGAHGIPQALPASKMASFGSDYYTNGYTQIDWGLNYILNRYGSPSNAWSHFCSRGWY